MIEDIGSLLEIVDTLPFWRFQFLSCIIKFDLPVDCDLSRIFMQLCFPLGSN